MTSLPTLTVEEFSRTKELKEEIDAALTDNMSGSEWVRYFAVVALGHLFSAYALTIERSGWIAETVAKFIHLLKDVDADVRYASVKTIGVIGSIDPKKVRPAIPRLIKLIEDPNDEVREITIDVLKKIALPEDIPAVLPLLTKREDVIKAS